MREPEGGQEFLSEDSRHDYVLRTSQYTEYKKEITRYRFFDDPVEQGKDAVFGIDVHLMKLVNFFKSAAAGYGTQKRVLLLHGPVGSAKSSISRLIKKGLEHYSKTDDGALYTFEWVDEENTEILGGAKFYASPMHEEPLKLIPVEIRKQFLEKINKGVRQERESILLERFVRPIALFSMLI